jgi:hypothetical protein
LIYWQKKNSKHILRNFQEYIRTTIGDNDIWISVDETTDRLGRYIVHLIIGKSSSEDPGVPFLLALEQLERKTTVIQFHVLLTNLCVRYKIIYF